MIRTIRKWRAQRIRELRMRDTAAQIKAALQAHFGLSKSPRFKRKSAKKFSSNYLVFDGAMTLGILRIENPFEKREPLATNKPYQAILNTPERIDHEWRCCEIGAPKRLTPKPLWRSDNAFMCEYLPYPSLLKSIRRNPDQTWDPLISAAHAVKKLHEAGIIHLDCWPQNIFKSPDGNHYFVDFEYQPAPFMNEPAQRVYDYLLMIESSWKFIKPKQRKKFSPWADWLQNSLTDEERAVDLNLLAPSLKRMLADPALNARLKEIFPNYA